MGNAYNPDYSTSSYTTGACWSTSPDPTINDNYLESYSSYDISVNATNLQALTTYYVRLYVSVSGETYYGTNQLVRTPHSDVGTFKEGGIVFWVNPNDTTKGLVCALSNISNGTNWGVSGVQNGATGEEIGDGELNTSIISSQNSVTAANYCSDYTAYGYTNWFLPSKNELKLLFDYKSAVDNGLVNNSGSPLGNYYWSSTEIDANNAWGFNDTEMIQSLKSNNSRVRAIRTY